MIAGIVENRIRPGFTLVELMVVVVIVAALASIGTMGARSMIEMAHRVDSMNDLRALTTFVLSGANDNNGRFPHLHKGTTHPHHFNKRNPTNPAANTGLLTLEDLIDMGLTKDTAFCMANKRWSSRADYYWNDFEGGTTAVFSYIYLANDNGWANDNSRFTRPSDSRARSFGRELDSLPATPKSTSEDRVWYPYLWADVCRRIGDDFLANFMTQDGRKVKGMNIIHMDGSGEWRPGKEIKSRYTGGGANFYW
jgi:prepilin-type N-terminal cleavage/methylation domain-containing protein